MLGTFAALLLLCLTAAPAVRSQAVAEKIPDGSKVFIQPASGFETYLAAALLKKKVPVIIVPDKSAADFIIKTSSEQSKASWARILATGDAQPDEEASITISDAKNGALVYAYAFHQLGSVHGSQTAAESCAKHLGNFMKTGKR